MHAGWLCDLPLNWACLLLCFLFVCGFVVVVVAILAIGNCGELDALTYSLVCGCLQLCPHCNLVCTYLTWAALVLMVQMLLPLLVMAFYHMDIETARFPIMMLKSPRAFWHSGRISGFLTLYNCFCARLVILPGFNKQAVVTSHFLKSRSRLSSPFIPTLNCLGITQCGSLVLLRARTALACLALNASLRFFFTDSFKFHILCRCRGFVSCSWQKWQTWSLHVGTSVLDVVNSVVYKEKSFLLDITRRVLRCSLDLGKEIIDTEIYAGVQKLTLPILQKAGLDLLWSKVISSNSTFQTHAFYVKTWYFIRAMSSLSCASQMMPLLFTGKEWHSLAIKYSAIN